MSCLDSFYLEKAVYSSTFDDSSFSFFEKNNFLSVAFLWSFGRTLDYGECCLLPDIDMD